MANHILAIKIKIPTCIVICSRIKYFQRAMILCRPLKRVLKKAIDTVVLLMVFWYAVYHFVLVEKTESAKNTWETVIGNMINLGFLIVDTSSKQ